MKRASIGKIAEVAGVSKSTVSWALRNHPSISAPTRDRIRAIADKLGYRPNATLAEVMSITRKSGSPEIQGTIALINASPLPIPTGDVMTELCSGARFQSETLGYTCDDFALSDFISNPKRLARILEARGIRGAVLFHASRQMGPALAPICSQFACATTCYKPDSPPLHCACNDQFFNAQQAVAYAFAAGYKRPVALINRWLDEQCDRRISAALRDRLETAPALAGKRVFLIPESDSDPKPWAPILRRVFDLADPDCFITHSHNVGRFLLPYGRTVGQNLGIIHLDRGEYCRSLGLAGMVQRYAEVGRAAADLVVMQLQAGEKGIPSVQRCVMVESYFEPGPSCRAPAR